MTTSDKTGRSRARDAIRTFNKHVLNPVLLRLAGREHFYAAVLRHTGRRSGRAYATPVVAAPVTDGFVIPLPYGTDVDWLRNVRAAGRATVRVHGTTYEVLAPEVIDAATALPQVAAKYRRTWRRFGIQDYLKVTVAG